MSSHKTVRQNEIDLLRVIAALSVFFLHYTDSFNYVNKIVPGNIYIGTFARYGHMGVPLFFVISGYVVTMTAMNKTFTGFAISRISRLYPAFWLSCIVAFLLPRLFPHIPTFLPWPSVKSVLVNSTMIPSVFGKQLINPAYWSLLEEMQFYLIISGIILFKLWDKMLPVLICWIIFYLVTGIYEYSRPDQVVGILVPKNSMYFITGILFYLLKTGYSAKWKLYSLLLFMFALCMAFSFYITGATNQLYKSTNGVSVYGFIFINLVIFFIFFLIATNRFSITSNKTLKLLGDLTYPFYLFHVYGLGLYWCLSGIIQDQVLLILMLVIIIAFSYIINRYLEKPMHRYFEKVLNIFSDRFKLYKA